MWTSGTTGRSETGTPHARRLRRTPRSRPGPARAATDPRRPRPPSPNLIPVSMALNAGLYNVLFGLRAGAPLVVMDGFDPAVFAELVRRFEIRSTVLPPAAMATLTDSRLDRSHAAAIRPLDHRTALTTPGPAVRRHVRGDGVERLRPGGAGRSDRLDRRRRQGVPGEARRGRPAPPGCGDPGRRRRPSPRAPAEHGGRDRGPRRCRRVRRHR